MNWNPDIGIPLAIAGALILIAIAVFGRPRKPDQGKRTGEGRASPRREPSFGEASDESEEDALADTLESELSQLARHLGADDDEEEAAEDAPVLGRRNPEAQVDRIVTLFVAAREGEQLDGAAIVVAAEKAGLAYGDMAIFHRLADAKPEGAPVFSVASMVKPGSFDLRNVHDIRTPGLTFFMTLPGPLPALDAWETLLPTAQRMAELLDASVLDEERNTLGRQRIAHLRDELRAYDRETERLAKRKW
ncbi:MAG: cell division protein ZipA [Lysobacteraceae bacterium]